MGEGRPQCSEMKPLRLRHLLERRGKWEHWMVGPCPDQVRYGFWLDTTTGAKWDDRFYEPGEGET